MADTKWDKPRDLLDDMIRNARELGNAWPHIPDNDLRVYWNREIDRAVKSLNMLRQAAIASQDMEHLQRIATTQRNLDEARTAGDQVWIDAEQAILDSLQREPQR